MSAFDGGQYKGGGMDLVALRAAVESAVDSYVFDVHPEAVGQPLRQEWVDAQLAEMRAALVEPTWRDVKIQDSHEQMIGKAEWEIRACVLVADDREGYELYFDPTQGGCLRTRAIRPSLLTSGAMLSDVSWHGRQIARFRPTEAIHLSTSLTPLISPEQGCGN
jgi:hypothetical protein